MATRISVIGDGAWATVCAIMLCENGHSVRLWSPFPEHAADMRETRENSRYLPGVPLPECLEITGHDADAFADATLALATTPSRFCRSVWRRLRPHVPSAVPICSVVKGMEPDTLLRPTQIVQDVLGELAGPMAVLSGPSIAPEVARRQVATVVVASEQEALARRVQKIISRPYFRVYTSPDIVGVELAGATKNVIAVAAGILDGMGAGHNAKAALLARGLAEITRLGTALGARAETFAGLAGMGDLVTTCFSPLGRNRSFGEAIGRGLTVEQAEQQASGVVEGVTTTAAVLELARRHGVEMPITEAIHRVLFEGCLPADAIAGLMSRPLRAEI